MKFFFLFIRARRPGRKTYFQIDFENLPDFWTGRDVRKSPKLMSCVMVHETHFINSATSNSKTEVTLLKMKAG